VTLSVSHALIFSFGLSVQLRDYSQILIFIKPPTLSKAALLELTPKEVIMTP
jgi:hypothetical protein